ncbi:MAG: DNA-methyltransferase [Chloroflexota bacterium]
MPELVWPTKFEGFNEPPEMRLESIIIPAGAESEGAELTDTLFLGDNLGVMQALLPEYEGKIDLIYADPPFFTNRAYPARVGRGEDSRRPQEWKLSAGYADSWKNIDQYLDMLYPRLKLMHRLLSPRGSLYLHLDWHANAYARILLDEIFGADKLLNEIVWLYHGPSPIRRAFNRKHDTILVYVKGDNYIFNVEEVREPYAENTIKTFNTSPKAGFGKMPDLERGKVPEDWWYFPVVARLHGERTGYPTQKPEALLERIIKVSSLEESLVADFFCGSGTTAVVAARLGRRYLAGDAAWRAVHTTRARLIKAVKKPFRLLVDPTMVAADWISYPMHIMEEIRLQWSEADLRIELSPRLLSDLDYWEVDPDYDGKTFRSLAQAHRHFRKGELAEVLSVHKMMEYHPIQVRVVKVDGSQWGITLTPPLGEGG